jgi:hypothetical protein
MTLKRLNSQGVIKGRGEVMGGGTLSPGSHLHMYESSPCHPDLLGKIFLFSCYVLTAQIDSKSREGI